MKACPNCGEDLNRSRGRPRREIPDRILEKIDKLRNLSDPVAWDEIANRLDESKSTIWRKYQRWKGEDNGRSDR